MALSIENFKALPIGAKVFYAVDRRDEPSISCPEYVKTSEHLWLRLDNQVEATEEAFYVAIHLQRMYRVNPLTELIDGL